MPTSRYFRYSVEDLKLLFITRSLPLGCVSKPSYRKLFGAQIDDDFGSIISSLCSHQLVSIGGDELRLTERGVFFADAIAGLFASKRVRELRAADQLRVVPDPGAAEFHMG